MYKKAWNNTCNITFSRYIYLRVYGLKSNLMWSVLKDEVRKVDFLKYLKFLFFKIVVDFLTSIKLMKFILNIKSYIKGYIK